MKYYSYFFTRQDISPEQQLVQTAHVALKLGTKSSRDSLTKESMVIDPDNTYFSVVGVRNLWALEAVQTILDHFNFKYEVFNEPDIKNEMTAIAVYPVMEIDRGPLLAFNLLKIDKK